MSTAGHRVRHKTEENIMAAKGQTETVTITTEQADAAITKLTAMGRALMTQVGERRFSFFDNGITEGSGIWGECLGGEFGAAKSARSAAGVLARLTSMDEPMFTSYDPGENSGLWYDLTALGAAVANRLAETPTDADAQEDTVAAKPAKKTASKKAAAKKVTKPAKAEKATKVEQVFVGTGTKRLNDVKTEVMTLDDSLVKMAEMTALIAEARELISSLSEARVGLAQEAKAQGYSYTDLAKAAGMSPARMAQIGQGRKAYTRVADR